MLVQVRVFCPLIRPRIFLPLGITDILPIFELLTFPSHHLVPPLLAFLSGTVEHRGRSLRGAST